MKSILALLSSALLALPVTLHAQQAETPEQPDPNQDAQTAPERGAHRPPPKHPIMEALDKNRDHVIDADEIKGAPEALLSLDKNSDGKLSVEEIRPEPPEKKETGQNGEDDQMSNSERRKMEREQRREERQSGNQQGQGPSGQGGQGRPQGPPPPR
jgi:hypothetical protein